MGPRFEPWTRFRHHRGDYRRRMMPRKKKVPFHMDLTDEVQSKCLDIAKLWIEKRREIPTKTRILQLAVERGLIEVHNELKMVMVVHSEDYPETVGDALKKAQERREEAKEDEPVEEEEEEVEPVDEAPPPLPKKPRVKPTKKALKEAEERRRERAKKVQGASQRLKQTQVDASPSERLAEEQRKEKIRAAAERARREQEEDEEQETLLDPVKIARVRQERREARHKRKEALKNQDPKTQKGRRDLLTKISSYPHAKCRISGFEGVYDIIDFRDGKVILQHHLGGRPRKVPVKEFTENVLPEREEW